MKREQVFNPRTAGNVVRYHTWPTLQRQTVAEHTFHVMRIYYAIFGRLPEVVAETIMWHDMAEIKTGDLPFPFKATHPEIKELLEPIEEHTVVELGGRVFDIEEYLQRRIKACDLLEMLEFGLYELNLGNKFAEPIVYDIQRVINNFDMNESDFKRVNLYSQATMEDYECAPTRITPIARTATR